MQQWVVNKKDPRNLGIHLRSKQICSSLNQKLMPCMFLFWVYAYAGMMFQNVSFKSAFFLGVGKAEWKQCTNRNRFSGFQSLEVFFFFGGPFAMYCGQSG